MPRRSRSSLPVGKVLGGIAAAVVLLGAGLTLLSPSRSMRTTAAFPVRDYLENADSLRGNTYQIEAQVSQTLGYSPASGRLVSVEAAGGDLLPILIPKSISANVERGQKLLFRVSVEEKGLVTAQEIQQP
jgi:hypothetical protein